MGTEQFVVLLVEDDPDDRLLMREAFLESGVSARVEMVFDGEELMNYLLRNGNYSDAVLHPFPDLILLDLNMPRKDGRETLLEIKNHPILKTIPVIVFTTSHIDRDVEKSYSLGANCYIPKPPSYQRLVEMLTVFSKYWQEVALLPAPRNSRLPRGNIASGSGAHEFRNTPGNTPRNATKFVVISNTSRNATASNPLKFEPKALNFLVRLYTERRK